MAMKQFLIAALAIAAALGAAAPASAQRMSLADRSPCWNSKPATTRPMSTCCARSTSSRTKCRRCARRSRSCNQQEQAAQSSRASTWTWTGGSSGSKVEAPPPVPGSTTPKPAPTPPSRGSRAGAGSVSSSRDGRKGAVSVSGRSASETRPYSSALPMLTTRCDAGLRAPSRTFGGAFDVDTQDAFRLGGTTDRRG